MEQNKLEMFIASTAGKFPPEKLILVRERLGKIDDSKLPVIQSIDYKDPTTLLIVSIFLGGLGVDRFMLGETGLGIAKLLTCGGMWIWTIIDWFSILGRTRELNYQKFSQAAL
jgi:TM2 domain-containing membrane protein YozV